jgi:CheY-like chemotaxis protein
MKNNAISLPDSSTRAARPTVLIVDDSRLMRVAIKKILKDEFELIEAVDGEDAWSRLMEDPAIACIFSDLSMPNLDGYGLLARVRGSDDAHVRALPFIVITGKEGDLGGLLEEVRGHGATDLVGKPFKSDEIIARTRSLLAVDTTPAVVMAAVAETQEAPEASPVEEAPIVDQAAAAEACRIHEEQEAARQAEEALAHRQAAEAEARRQKEEAEAQRIREEQEAARLAEEERCRQVEEAARRQAAEAEARRQEEEDEARRIREEQEAARRAEAAARQAAEQAEQERLAAEAAARQAEEEARICEELRSKARLMAEERERQRLAEEQALRLNPLQGLFVRLALPFMSLGNRLLRLGKDEALEKLRKRLR